MERKINMEEDIERNRQINIETRTARRRMKVRSEKKNCENFDSFLSATNSTVHHIRSQIRRTIILPSEYIHHASRLGTGRISLPLPAGPGNMSHVRTGVSFALGSTHHRYPGVNSTLGDVEFIFRSVFHVLVKKFDLFGSRGSLAY